MKLTWFAFDCNLYTHPKMLKLSAELKTDVDTLAGKLGRLWAWAKLSGNEDGDIGALPAQEIADIMRWKKSASALFNALVGCGFLDAEDGRNFLHGWAELNGDMTAKKRRDNERKKAGKSAENPRKKTGASTEIPGTQYSTGHDSTKKEPSPSGDGKKESAPAPDFALVQETAKSMGCPELAKPFYDYYAAGDWRDSGGKPMAHSWRQKLVAWKSREDGKLRRQFSAGHGGSRPEGDPNDWEEWSV